MRIIVMFDLPMETADEKRAYRHFHEYLIKKGFVMMQKSVYSKLALNRSVTESVKTQLRKNVPPKGLLQILEITEKQFGDMEFLLGEAQSKVIDTDKRLVEL